MFPWLWFWFPQVNFPFSGAVSQDIHPNSNWFSDLIEPGAGDPEIERQAFEVASYGKQLGLITDVLLAVSHRAGRLSPEVQDTIRRLEDIQQKIQAIKDASHGRDGVTDDEVLVAQVRALRERGGDAFDQLSARLVPLLEKPSAPE